MELRFAEADLLGIRFAISPLAEALGALGAVLSPSRHAYHLPWLREARARQVIGVRLDVRELAALLGAPSHVPGFIPSYVPDFLSPPPDTPLGDADEQLRLIRATADAQVLRELRQSVADRPVPPALVPLLADLAAARELLADQMAAVWSALVEPYWPLLRDLLHADILGRARQLVDGGARAMLAGLHDRVSWHAGMLHVARTDDAGDAVELGGRGLQLVPSVFGWPHVQLMLVPPWQPALIYPARGIGALWARTGGRPALAAHDGLPAVIGRTRTDLLRELIEPSTTTALARTLRVAPATVAGHLKILRGARLVASHRVGRSVYYETTPLGYALVHDGGAMTADPSAEGMPADAAGPSPVR